MKALAVTLAPGDPMTVDALSRRTVRRGVVWQGAVRKMPMWIGPPGAHPYRPWGAIWISTKGRPLHMKLGGPEMDDAGALAWAAFEELAAQETGGELPGTVELDDSALADALRPRLEALGIRVAVVRELSWVDEAVSVYHQEAGGSPLPGIFDAPDVFEGEARAFWDAAAKFYRAQPWRELTDEDVFRVSGALMPGRYDWGVVLGAAGQEYGLALFNSRAEHERMRAGDREALSEALLVFFGPVHELPIDDADWMLEHGVEVAGRDAWPWVVERRGRAEMRRPGARLLARAEQLLRAFAQLRPEEIDRGRWTATVPSARGEAEVTIELPDLLGEPAPVVPGARPPMPPEAGERVMAEMHRFLAKQKVGTPEEAMRLVNDRFKGPIDAIPSTSTTQLEKAQDLCWKAWDARGRRKRLLARAALELSSDCADAYVLLAREATAWDERVKLLREGVAAGERALGRKRFKSGDPFWGDVTTRPYMRAAHDLMEALRDGDDDDLFEAMRLGERLIELNPGDNQGVRFGLISLAFDLDELDVARRVLAQYAQDRRALLEYPRALLAFKEEGDTARSRKLLRRAIASNRFAIEYFAGRGEPEEGYPDTYAFGSIEEAALVFDEFESAWLEAGAVEWAAKVK